MNFLGVTGSGKTLAAGGKAHYLVLIVPYFVDEIGGYGRNNTRRTGGVCGLDSCNG